MSTITNGSMKLIKSDITDIIHSTIGSDLPNNFDKIDKTVDEVNTRINNILTTPVDGVSAQEIIDARGDSPTLGTRLNSMQTQTDSLQEEVDSLSTTGIPKLVSFEYDITATTDNQTVFTIPYEYLSIATDTVEVFVNGIAVPDNYYIVTEPVEVESEITLGFVTLTEAKPTGTIVKVRILKNVPNGDEGSVDGDIITVDSIPVNRINSGELDEFMNDSLSDINTSLNQIANPNLLINGDFQVWQRGKIFNYKTDDWGNKYTADRWRVNAYGTATTDYNAVVKRTDTGLQIYNTGIEKQNVCLSQVFEDIDINKLKGKTVTLSIKLKINKQIEDNLRVYINTTNNSWVGADNECKLCKPKSINTYEIISLTRVIPEDAKVLGVQFFTPMYDDLIIDIEYLKLELGRVATPFVPRSYGEELALCQRYCTIYTQNTVFPQIWKKADRLEYTASTPCEMRVHPTLQYKVLQIYDMDTGVRYDVTGDISVVRSSNILKISVAVSDTTTMKYTSLTTQNNTIILDSEIY